MGVPLTTEKLKHEKEAERLYNLRILNDIINKFEKTNKISGEDMKMCNSLWRKYGKK